MAPFPMEMGRQPAFLLNYNQLETVTAIAEAGTVELDNSEVRVAPLSALRCSSNITALDVAAGEATATRQLKWFAVHVKANREYVTNASLSGRGYETCLPLYSVRA